jgi:DNA sulfur modification protein DndE
MKPPLENIRVSQRSREILIALKRKTGIANWNILCRWAFCDSLANPSRPVTAISSAESNIEMSWQTFAGDLADYLLAALATRAAKDGVRPAKTEMAAYFRNHLERGIRQLGRRPQPSLQAMIVLRELGAYSPTAKQPTTDGVMESYEPGI